MRDRMRLLRAEGWVAALLALLVGLLLLYVSGRNDWWKDRTGMQYLVGQVGGLFVVGVALALLWDWRGRRAMAEEVYQHARLAADVTSAGLTRFTNQYISEVDWADYFANVRHLDIFFAYGRTWRNTHFAQLREVISREGSRLRIVLPDPDEPALVARLASRFGMTTEEVATAVRQAHADFVALARTGPGAVEVYYHDGDPTFSYYRFDNRAVVTLYSHARQRRLVPTFACQSGGTLYDFLRQEFEDLVGLSRPAPEVP